MLNYEYLTVECKATDDRIRWKIIMKPDGFQALKTTDPTVAQTIPSPPFEYEDEDLLTVIKHIEGIVGISVSDLPFKGLPRAATQWFMCL